MKIILSIYIGMNIFMCGNYYGTNNDKTAIKIGMYILTGLFGTILFIVAVGWDLIRDVFYWFMGVTQLSFWWSWYVVKQYDKIPTGETIISYDQKKQYLLKMKKKPLQQRSLLKCIDKVFTKHNITSELIEEIKNNDNHPLREHKLKKETL